MEFDPTLQLNNEAPELGGQGKMRSDSGMVWGGLPQNVSRNSFTTLDTLEENGAIILSHPQTIQHENRQIVEGGPSKNLPEFYEPVSFEDRSLVNPKELAKKLLAKVDYQEEFGADMLEFFLSKSRTRIAREIHYSKTGEMFEKEKDIPNAPPMFSEFGRTIGVSDRTLKGWVKKYPAFQEAYEICTDIIQEFFIENGVKGNYASQFSIFAAKNLTKMKDVMVNKNENYDMKSILDAIEKGMSPNGD